MLETIVKKLTFQQKLWIPLLCSLLCITGIFLYNAVQTRDLRIEERSGDLSNLGDMGVSILKMYGELAETGKLSKEEAQKQAIAVVKGLRYGKDGYLSIVTTDTVALMNPFKPANDGKDVSEVKDANGVYLYRDIVKLGRSDSGAGRALGNGESRHAPGRDRALAEDEPRQHLQTLGLDHRQRRVHG